jgi:SPX domain protein involved in polyphosphate accumulation
MALEVPCEAMLASCFFHMQATFSHISANSSAELSELRCDVQELIKFVALNYLAVVKAIKKRNRHLKVRQCSQGMLVQHVV